MQRGEGRIKKFKPRWGKVRKKMLAEKTHGRLHNRDEGGRGCVIRRELLLRGNVETAEKASEKRSFRRRGKGRRGRCAVEKKNLSYLRKDLRASTSRYCWHEGSNRRDLCEEAVESLKCTFKGERVSQKD